MYEKIKVRLTGEAPGMLMHNAQLVNPLNEWKLKMKPLTDKKKDKTEEDLAELARLEWRGGLYLDESGKPCVPPHVLEGAIVCGAKKRRHGPKAKTAVMVMADTPLTYAGPKSLGKRELDPNCRLYCSVRVSSSRVYRCRPLFRGWTAEPEIDVDTSVFNARDFLAALEDAGRFCGIGDYRPRYGRFSVEVIK